MPIVGGPKSSKRRVMSSVCNSIMLYAAPIWETALAKTKLRQRVVAVSRKISIRISCAYRTVSAAASHVVAGTPPLDLLARERSDTHNGMAHNAARELLYIRWQEQWSNSTTGRWTRTLVADIRSWILRSHGETDYHLTQVLTGHGCFAAYLHRFQLAAEPTCIQGVP
nr:unnamed protein product [Callosobruchus analis]